MIGIRVDANENIATGHLMRCLSIAHELKNQGQECIFISADKKSKDIVNNNGFNCVILNSCYLNMDSEIGKLYMIIDEKNICKLVIDSYYVTNNYLNNIRNFTKTIYIDDINSFYYNVNMLINYSPYYDLFNYSQEYKGTSTKLVLGCNYIPLRHEFKNLPYKDCSKSVKNILITCGGTDNFNFIGKLLNKIVTEDLFADMKFHIILGAFNKNRANLYKLALQYNNIILYENVNNISKIMTWCDIAVTAGGSTMYELCACGIPSISFSFADNQVYGVKRLDEMGIIKYSGDIRNDENLLFIKIILNIQNYFDSKKRLEISHYMKNMVDGKGAQRLVEQIISL